jgi:dehydrogenase/reductase SDR family member 7
MNVARAWLPVMLAQGCGRIVPVASMAGRVPSPGQAVYSAAKHALVGYFASMASEVAGRGVGVTIVCPGPIAGAVMILGDVF